MKPFITFAVILSLLSTASVAAPRYSVFTGMSKPFTPTDFKDLWRSGFNLGGAVAWSVAPHLEIDGTMQFDQFQLDDVAFLNTLTTSTDIYAAVSGGSVTILDLSARLKYYSPIVSKQLAPYLFAGVGVGMKTTSEKEITTADRSTKEPRESLFAPAAGIGLGFEMEIAKNSSLLVEGGFNLLFTEKTTVYFPLKIGVVIGRPQRREEARPL